MKKGNGILTLIFALWAMITGVVDSDIHIIVSVIFAVLVIFHVLAHRKILVSNFKSTRWKWVLITVAFMVILLTSIWD
jgi:hypothetical protein